MIIIMIDSDICTKKIIFAFHSLSTLSACKRCMKTNI